MLTLYGDIRSGNCLKVKWLLDWMGRDYRWIDVDILTGGSRTPEFLAMNTAGQVPTLVLDDGRPLAQSNAILLSLAEGTALIPVDDYDRGGDAGVAVLGTVQPRTLCRGGPVPARLSGKIGR
jgi:glutathione S-transferase